MWIASKYNEVKPLELETVKRNLGHNNFEGWEIVDTEREILHALSYKIPNSYLWGETYILLKSKEKELS